MRVLVTGRNGQVGSYLVDQLYKQKKVTLLALNSQELDITKVNDVNNRVMDFRPDIIINAAAYTAVDKAETDIDLAFNINSDGAQYLAEAAERIGAAILHISTDYVFDGNKEGSYSESDLPMPQGVYGKSKLAGEIAVANACQRHIILRTAWVFSEYGNNFVKTMLRLGQERESLNIVGDQFGGPTYAGDIASTLIQIAKRIVQGDCVEYGIYHYSGLPHVSWCKFADKIFTDAVEQKVIDIKPVLSSIATTEYPTPAKRPQNSRLDCTKLLNNFAIKSCNWKRALESGVIMVLKEYK
ncbi:dTDP-4-dehydrorhamnose reductase [uncultured Shewanella sp.]|uniref:dTDP-4-dehydrorhamnose reductase n=1 Tax=uncultured Shewanella sp. TaxID=173975 RepID=UPI0026216483|nr:dTDP-4-dehydrorhamnose reductase [uncultured Shewanella sp.]